jgi:hypothetical protein
MYQKKLFSLASLQYEVTLLSDAEYLGRFSMVCRDAYTHQAKLVNPLVTSTSEERALYTLGEGV